jgi:hypothetical protein
LGRCLKCTRLVKGVREVDHATGVSGICVTAHSARCCI